MTKSCCLFLSAAYKLFCLYLIADQFPRSVPPYVLALLFLSVCKLYKKKECIYRKICCKYQLEVSSWIHLRLMVNICQWPVIYLFTSHLLFIISFNHFDSCRSVYHWYMRLLRNQVCYRRVDYSLKTPLDFDLSLLKGGYSFSLNIFKWAVFDSCKSINLSLFITGTGRLLPYTLSYNVRISGDSLVFSAC